MAFQERDYYREVSPANPLAGSIVVQLIVLTCAVYLVDIFFFSPTHGLLKAMSVYGDTIAKPLYWWQFLTAGFAHSWRGPWHLIGNMIGLFFFGRLLEKELGWKELLRFYLVAIVLGTVVWSARQYLFEGPLARTFGDNPIEIWQQALGASGGVVALILLFCLRHPTATLYLYFAIPVPAWVAGVLLVASDLFGVQPLEGQKIAFDIHLVGAAFALAYWKLGWNFGKLPGMAGLGRMFRSLTRSLKPKPDLRVHDPEAYYEDLDADGDRVLEKIKREGEQSLTKRERQVLEAYSRRMRQKLR